MRVCGGRTRNRPGCFRVGRSSRIFGRDHVVRGGRVRSRMTVLALAAGLVVPGALVALDAIDGRCTGNGSTWSDHRAARSHDSVDAQCGRIGTGRSFRARKPGFLLAGEPRASHAACPLHHVGAPDGGIFTFRTFFDVAPRCSCFAHACRDFGTWFPNRRAEGVAQRHQEDVGLLAQRLIDRHGSDMKATGMNWHRFSTRCLRFLLLGNLGAGGGLIFNDSDVSRDRRRHYLASGSLGQLFELTLFPPALKRPTP